MTITRQPTSAPTARDIAVAVPDDFRLASGESLPGSTLRARLHGPPDGPLVVVAGGISAGRAIADGPGGPGWWGWAVRDGGPVDTARFRVLAFDWLPEPDIDRVVTITTHDQARLLAVLLDHLGEPRVDAFVGASYGGCVGLAFAESFPHRLARLTVISAAHRAHPAATAWRGVQRRLLALGLERGFETEAVALSRELAMTTYRSPEEFDSRFGDAAPPEAAGDDFAVCAYLKARGQAYRGATSARRWSSLSDSLDRHRVDPARVACPLTVAAFRSDQLVPIEDSRDLAEAAPHLERWVEAPSLFGHDAFLKERAFVGDALATALSPLHACPSQEIAA